ncbi:MAG TPA: hypothetical protein VKV28_00840 [Candidatus Binataceae bacterium]|nr:hypothetical protein [Candidatus Binataceae bacterium]
MAEGIFDPDRFPDNFYSGQVVRLSRADYSGTVRSDSGREYRFKFPFVSVIGARIGGIAPGFEQLSVGARVAFDVGWNSKGLVVTTLKRL